MATRGGGPRGQVAKEQQFEGRVRHWEKRWVPYRKGTRVDEVRLQLLKWMPTEERCEPLKGPRHPHIRPLKDPHNKPYSVKHTAGTKSRAEALAAEEKQLDLELVDGGGPEADAVGAATAAQPSDAAVMQQQPQPAVPEAGQQWQQPEQQQGAQDAAQQQQQQQQQQPTGAEPHSLSEPSAQAMQTAVAGGEAAGLGIGAAGAGGPVDVADTTPMDLT